MLVETYYNNKTISWRTKDIHTYKRQMRDRKVKNPGVFRTQMLLTIMFQVGLLNQLSHQNRFDATLMINVAKNRYTIWRAHTLLGIHFYIQKNVYRFL